MRKGPLPPPARQDTTPTEAVDRNRRGPAPFAAPEPPDDAESDVELDYRSFEEQCKSRPLPPGIALPPPAGATYSELFSHTYTIEPEDPDEA